MKRALLVGIDDYDRFSGLRGCVNDVNRLEALFSRNDDESHNFDCQTPIGTTGRVTRDALLGDVDAALLAGGADVALLYFAGHRAGRAPTWRL